MTAWELLTYPHTLIALGLAGLLWSGAWLVFVEVRDAWRGADSVAVYVVGVELQRSIDAGEVVLVPPMVVPVARPPLAFTTMPAPGGVQ